MLAWWWWDIRRWAERLAGGEDAVVSADDVRLGFCRKFYRTRRHGPTRTPTLQCREVSTHSVDLHPLDGRTFADMATAQAAIDAFVHEYNHDRPHQSLGRRPPAERFATARPAPGPDLDTRALEQAPGRRDGPE